MVQFAPPARRGDFLYSSILYTDGGNQNHHPRATVDELTALLRPEAPKHNKKLKIQRPPDIIKDQPGHWYTAQLIHYGLPVTRDKNAAKVRLLDALNERRLEVPAWVTKLEGELKQEWSAENRKLKKANKSSSAIGSPLPKSSKGRMENATTEPSPLPSQPKRKRDDRETERVNDKKLKSEHPATPRKARTPAPTPTPSRGARIKEEKTDTGALSRSQAIKNEPEYKNYDDLGPQDITFSGTYTKTCPAISDMFSQAGPAHLHLALLRDESRGVWWASFSWWSWDCIIQMNPGPSYETLGQACSLGWRLHDYDSGAMHFGRGKTGSITFFPDQTIEGVLVNMPFLGTVEFWGRRIPGPKYVGRTGNGFQFEWNAFVNTAYRR